jgi:hypothetical protein
MPHVAVLLRHKTPSLSDGIEQFAAMSKRSDAKLLKVHRRQARKDRFINVILAGGAVRNGNIVDAPVDDRYGSPATHAI